MSSMGGTLADGSSRTSRRRVGAREACDVTAGLTQGLGDVLGPRQGPGDLQAGVSASRGRAPSRLNSRALDLPVQGGMQAEGRRPP